MPFGLGVPFAALHKGRAANKFGVLTGQIVGVDTSQTSWPLGTSVVVLVALAVLWRPFADPGIATPQTASAIAAPDGIQAWRRPPAL
jgi:zinc/manganese transport system permease protein